MYMYMYSYRPPHSLLGLRKSMADSADADTLLAALNAGVITKAAYAARAREAGVAANVVAAHLRAAPAPDGVAAVAAEKERLERQAAQEAMGAAEVGGESTATGGSASHPVTSAGSSSSAAVEISTASDDPVENSLAWLRARPGRSAKWGARAAERLSAANDFLYDLEFIDSCGIDDEACTHMATCLRANCTLTAVDFGGGSNRIGDEGCAALCDALRTNATVTMLSLADNAVGEAGAKELASLLSSSCELVELDLQRNQGIGDAAKAELRTAWDAVGTREAPRLRL